TTSPRFPYTTLFRSLPEVSANPAFDSHKKITSSFQVPFLKEYTFNIDGKEVKTFLFINESKRSMIPAGELSRVFSCSVDWNDSRSEEHTSELQSREK